MSNFSWSVSRHNTFSLCQKQYYYHYYGAKDGWKTTASEEAQLVYRLKGKTSVPMFLGSVVHSVIATALRELRYVGIAPDMEDMLEWFVEEVKKQYDLIISKKGFTDTPDGDEVTLESLLSLSDDAEVLFQNFFKSDTWDKLINFSDQYEIKQVDQLEQFELDGTTTYAAVDLIMYDNANDIHYIIDWKTGKPNDKDEFQLNFYGIYLLSTYNQAELGRIVCVNEYLKTSTNVQTIPNDMQVDNTFEIFALSRENMFEKLSNTSTNSPLDGVFFEEINVEWACKMCPYQSVCKPPVLKGEVQ